MAKVLTGVQPGGRTEAEMDVIAGAPAAALQERTPQATPAGEFAELLEAPSVDTPALSAEGQELAGIMGREAPEGAAPVAPEMQAEVERQQIAPLSPDLSDRPGAFREWQVRAGATDTPSIQADGGLIERANNLAAAFNYSGNQQQQGLALAPVTKEARDALKNKMPDLVPELEAQGAPGSLSSAMHQAGAFLEAGYEPDAEGVNRFHGELNSDFLRLGSVVTENMLADGAFGEGEKGLTFGADEEADATGKGVISKASGNGALGQQINREWARMNGREVTDLPQKEAAILGDAFKEMYASANPEYIKRTPEGGQVYFKVTDAGQAALKASATERKNLFPTQNIRPSKQPLPRGKLVGDALQSRRAKKFVGKVKKKPHGQRILEEATENMAQVANVVDKQRAKIMLSMALPMLAGANANYADNFGAGLNKMADFQLEAEVKFPTNFDQQRQYVDQQMMRLQNKLAQEIRAVATERNGANYLTYGIQSFNGRIAPQQTYFDPTTSKIVRFVTRNAVPAPIKQGGKFEKNLRQMYAMMLVPSVQPKGKIKADALLPDVREQALQRYTPQLRQWGTMLRDVMNNTMTDEQYEQIMTAIEQGKPLAEIQFPTLEIPDPELVKAIQKKGEDGPHLIDGLIDFANYMDAMEAGRPYHSYFNAYIDGETNGIASNGIQMGNYNVASGTGVVRNSVSRARGLYLNKDQDIRDSLAETLLADVENNGWGDLSDNVEPSLTAVAQIIYNYRDLNKATTMTFGYGKELASFKKDIGAAVQTMIGQSRTERSKPVEEQNPQLAAFEAHVKVLDEALVDERNEGRDNLVKMLHARYTPALASALSTDALASRGIMRGAAITFALMDQLFTIQSATGFDINLGAEVVEGADPTTATTYNMYGTDVGKHTVYDYQTRSSAAAARAYVDEGSGEKSYVPGEHAYGGSLPGPVQSMDAATVAMTASGKSWEKLKSRSNGNPYLHTIYDAFKMDAMGYDTVLEEVNKNWLDAGMQWSYLEETQKALREGVAEFKARVNADPRAVANTDLNGEFQMIGWLLTPETKEGDRGPYQVLNNLRTKLMAVVNNGVMDEEAAFDLAKQTERLIMDDFHRATGYDWKKPRPLTVGEVYAFTQAFVNRTQLPTRLEAMKNKTNKKKARLRQVIAGRGPQSVLQYYAH